MLSTHLLAAAGSGHGIYKMNYLQAIVLGIIQGVFELFPLSSLGHTVLIPSWIGGSWATLVRQESQSESPYLAFIVGLHLANAVAIIVFYLREWARLVAGFFRSLVRRQVRTDAERLAWLIVIATIPVGILGLVFEHTFRTLFAKPVAAAAFLSINGLILLGGEWLRRRNPAETQAPTTQPGTGSALARFRSERLVTIDEGVEATLAERVTLWSALWIGASQALALFAGISREGVAVVGGLYRGLSSDDALRFAFLLSAPVIFAAGALKVPDLAGPLGNGIHGQIIAGSVAAVVASLAAIFFLTRFFRALTLKPFAVYSLLFGVASLIRFGLF